MNPWRGLEHHIEEQLAMGRLLTAEVDSFYLPDTAGISLRARARQDHDRAEHDRSRPTAGSGTSTTRATTSSTATTSSGIFGHGRDQPEVLLPYVELVKLDGVRALDDRAVARRRARARAGAPRAPPDDQPGAAVRQAPGARRRLAARRGTRDLSPVRLRDVAPVRQRRRAERLAVRMARRARGADGRSRPRVDRARVGGQDRACSSSPG